MSFTGLSLFQSESHSSSFDFEGRQSTQSQSISQAFGKGLNSKSKQSISSKVPTLNFPLLNNYKP